MARNKDSGFGAADGFDFEDKYNKEEPVKPQATTGYEKRTKQIGVVVTPSIYQGLKDLKYKGKIKSSNDLINDLLEEYIKNNI